MSMKDNRYYIHAHKFVLNFGIALDGYLEIIDGKFGTYFRKKPTDAPVIDYKDKVVAPGLVDTHIHGFLGHDVMDCNLEGLEKIARGLLSCGVTTFLPTTLTASINQLNEVCSLIGENYTKIKGAKIGGIFFEGPFFTEEHKGAQNTSYMSDPDIDVFNNWQKLARGLIKKIALAPERKGSVEFIREVTKTGVKVALGHSSATYNQAIDAVYAGASIFVHTYNGMSGLNHHNPGMVGAAMDTPETFGELICDGHHVKPVAANALIRAKGVNRVALITDCMTAGGMPEGDYMLGEFPVVVKDGAARLRDIPTSLAGSVLKLSQAIKNLYAWGRLDLYDVIKMATYIPAISIDIADKCGTIKEGRAADFIILDEDLNLEKTYLDGNVVFEK